MVIVIDINQRMHERQTQGVAENTPVTIPTCEARRELKPRQRIYKEHERHGHLQSSAKMVVHSKFARAKNLCMSIN